MKNTKKILVIDDEENTRNAIKRMLHESMPYVCVIESGSSEHTLEIAKAHQPDLILLDVLMPKVNGLTVLKTLKESKNREIKKIPVIMITGIGNREVSIKAKKMGAADYITKPFNDKIFLLKIKKYMKINQKNFLKVLKQKSDSKKS